MHVFKMPHNEYAALAGKNKVCTYSVLLFFSVRSRISGLILLVLIQWHWLYTQLRRRKCILVICTFVSVYNILSYITFISVSVELLIHIHCLLLLILIETLLIAFYFIHAIKILDISFKLRFFNFTLI